jgi:hypothetical protein
LNGWGARLRMLMGPHYPFPYPTPYRISSSPLPGFYLAHPVQNGGAPRAHLRAGSARLNESRWTSRESSSTRKAKARDFHGHVPGPSRMLTPPLVLPQSPQHPPPPLGSDFGGWVTAAPLGSCPPEAVVYECARTTEVVSEVEVEECARKRRRLAYELVS